MLRGDLWYWEALSRCQQLCIRLHHSKHTIGNELYYETTCRSISTACHSSIQHCGVKCYKRDRMHSAWTSCCGLQTSKRTHDTCKTLTLRLPLRSDEACMCREAAAEGEEKQQLTALCQQVVSIKEGIG